ncbi:MAG: ferritin-like domain-containing protein [Acidobacteriota bacterium]|nr:ferritin-like domain-containing protein [Acidobacteriota bacterium]
MSDHLTLEAVDVDGAIQEALDEVEAPNRSAFLKKALVAGGTTAFGGVVFGGLPKLVAAAPSPSQDAAILNFALTLEYLESSFYTEAVANGALSGNALTFAKVVKSHEDAHVAFLKKALGSKAGAKPTFDFKGTTSDQMKFIATSVALEAVGVGAYNGQGQNLTKPTLAAAAMIVSVEARHNAWIRAIANEVAAPDAFDPLFTKQQTLAKVTATGFIQ